MSAVYKQLITLAEIHSDSEVEDDRGKDESCVSAIIDALLTVLRLQTLSTGFDKGVMVEDGKSNEYEVQEDVMYMMIDLVQVSGDLLDVSAAYKYNGDHYGDKY